MKFVIIFGPHAVGKMTVGQELSKVTGLTLNHNHMTIDLVSNFFSYGDKKGRDLVDEFRMRIFEEFSSSDLPGMIFTYVWQFNDPTEKKYIEKITQLFKRNGAEIFYVELEADFDERLKRNITENRLIHKPTKRDVVFSTKNMKDAFKKYRLNSLPGEINEKNYIRINNENLKPKEVADKIKKEFNL